MRAIDPLFVILPEFFFPTETLAADFRRLEPKY